MRYFTVCILLLLTVLTITGCGDVEEDPKPLAPIEIPEIPENYYENSEVLYKPTAEQVEELLKLRFPHNWYDEEDPELHAKYYYAMLLQKYGDIPAVHIEAQFYRLALLSNGKPMETSSEDLILRLTATYLLWPDPQNLSVLQRTLRRLQEDEILLNTDDPDLYVEIATKQLIRQHGDIPEVHTVVEGDKKMQFGGFRIVTDADKDEYIHYLRAKYVLQPTEHFLCILNAHIEAKENGTPFHLIEHDCVESTLDEILDVIMKNEE
ncbi:MAG: hypothetical protein OXM61_02920 [Candidatus Poribacteria bacterium]|nr:hypothetical protein [Candidatus Poribacteria bacterium]